MSDSSRAPVGEFVPLNDPPRAGKRSANVGWIVAANGCHIWQGSRGGSGYGVAQENGRQRPVHAMRYEREVGPIPEGMDLDHYICETRLCCNPHHVRPATRRENLLRGNTIVAECRARTHCPRGHAYEGVNLDPYWLAKGRRKCIICRDLVRASYNAANREHLNAYAREQRAKRKRERQAA